jgi:hypothetical protein
MIPIENSLGFEVVDYAVEYIGFKNHVSYFRAGNKENFKLEVMIRQLLYNENPHLNE